MQILLEVYSADIATRVNYLCSVVYLTIYCTTLRTQKLPAGDFLGDFSKKNIFIAIARSAVSLPLVEELTDIGL